MAGGRSARVSGAMWTVHSSLPFPARWCHLGPEGCGPPCYRAPEGASRGREGEGAPMRVGIPESSGGTRSGLCQQVEEPGPQVELAGRPRVCPGSCIPPMKWQYRRDIREVQKGPSRNLCESLKTKSLKTRTHTASHSHTSLRVTHTGSLTPQGRGVAALCAGPSHKGRGLPVCGPLPCGCRALFKLLLSYGTVLERSSEARSECKGVSGD